MSLPLEDLGLPSSVLVWQASLLTFVSFTVGILGGFVGLALGTMRLPVLLLLGISSPIAAGTNIAVSTASAFIGSARHLRDGRVDLRITMVVELPSLAGGFIGGFISGRAPEALLTLAVGILVLWQGIELIARARADRNTNTNSVEKSANRLANTNGTLVNDRLVAGAGIGLIISMLGGTIGLILGSIRLPTLVRILQINPFTAVGTNLTIGFMMGTMGWIGHMSHGQVDYPLIMLMGTSAVAGSSLGAKLTGRVSFDELITATGIVLLFVGTLLMWRAVSM